MESRNPSQATYEDALSSLIRKYQYSISPSHEINAKTKKVRSLGHSVSSMDHDVSSTLIPRSIINIMPKNGKRSLKLGSSTSTSSLIDYNTPNGFPIQHKITAYSLSTPLSSSSTSGSSNSSSNKLGSSTFSHTHLPLNSLLTSLFPSKSPLNSSRIVSSLPKESIQKQSDMYQLHQVQLLQATQLQLQLFQQNQLQELKAQIAEILYHQQHPQSKPSPKDDLLLSQNPSSLMNSKTCLTNSKSVTNLCTVSDSNDKSRSDKQKLSSLTMNPDPSSSADTSHSSLSLSSSSSAWTVHNIHSSSSSVSSPSATGYTKIVPCNHCGRKFNTRAYEIHQKVCQKVFQSKREEFDFTEHRWKGTLPESEIKQIMMKSILSSYTGPKKAQKKRSVRVY